MIEDTTRSVLRGIRDRLASPLTGGFVLAWCVTNWSVLVLLFGGDVPSGERVAGVRRALDQAGPASTVVIPAVAAVSYAVVYPWVTGLVRWLSAFPESWAREREYGAGGTMPPTAAEWRAIQETARGREATIETLRGEVERQRVELRTAADTANSKQQQFEQVLTATTNTADKATLELATVKNDLVVAVTARAAADALSVEQYQVIESISSSAIEFGRAVDPKFPEGVAEASHANVVRAAFQLHASKHLERTQELARANNRHQAAIDAANEDGRTARDRLFRVLQALGLTLDGTRAIEKSIVAVESKRRADLGAKPSLGGVSGAVASKELAKSMNAGVGGAMARLSELERIRREAHGGDPPASSP